MINKMPPKSDRLLPGRRIDFQWRQDDIEGSDMVEMTENSSIYCVSPLSSVRATAQCNTRNQLKREILRLYQRAAADIDRVDSIQNAAPVQIYSIRSRSVTNSSPSQPSSSSPANTSFPFADPSSPVFGPSRHRTGSESSQSHSSPIQRPSTTNGTSPPATKMFQNRNTSF